jgi:hypothetical protein
MPIEIAISPATAAGPSTPSIQTADLRERHQVFTFPSSAEPTSVVLDPNAWTVMQATLERKQ